MKTTRDYLNMIDAYHELGSYYKEVGHAAGREDSDRLCLWGGAVGSAVAGAFARVGAEVHLAGRTLERLERVGADIRGRGGTAPQLLGRDPHLGELG